MGDLILIIIKNIVIPELALFMKKRMDETGRLPTKEELEAEVDRRANDIIMEGKAFLARPSELPPV